MVAPTSMLIVVRRPISMPAAIMIIEPSNPQPAGRTLDFLSQEMLREANTIASKSADVEISRRIVEIKTAIDRIKEQAQNAE